MRNSFICSVIFFTLCASMQLYSKTADGIMSYIDCGDGTYGTIFIYDGDGDGKLDTQHIIDCDGEEWFQPLTGWEKDWFNGDADFCDRFNNSKAVVTSGNLDKDSDWEITIFDEVNGEAIAKFIGYPESEDKLIEILPLVDINLNKSSSDVYNNDIRVYPNPVINNFTISTNSNIFSLSIFDIKGKKVYSQEFDNNQIEINTNNLHNGVYVLHIYTPEGLKTSKIIINK